MRRVALLAVLSVAVLGGSSAHAGPPLVCVPNAGCVSAEAAPGRASADAGVSACGLVPVGTCVEAGAGVRYHGQVVDLAAQSATYLAAACSWGGTPGNRVDYGGTATAAPYTGGSLVAIDITCRLYVTVGSNTWFYSTDGVYWQGQSMAHQTVFPPQGAALLACVFDASATWSDGYTESYADC